MELSTDDTGEALVVRVAGEVDLHSSPAARTAILAALMHRRPVAVDLSGVRYMDSSGVASLVEGYQIARRQGSAFSLIAPAPAVMSVLKLARLDTVFPIQAAAG